MPFYAEKDVPAVQSRDNSPPNTERLITTASVSVTLTQKQQEKVCAMLGADLQDFPKADFRNRYRMLDLAYYMEGGAENESQRRAISSEIRELYKGLDLPILQPNIDAAHAYLVGIFTTGHPIFGVVSDSAEEDRQEAAKQMEAIIEENARATSWARNINLTIKNGLKYNIGCSEIDWKVRRTFLPKTNNQETMFRGVSEEILRAGNEIRCTDMYNTFFDFTTPAAEIQQRGDYAGYVERLTLVQLYTKINNLILNGGQVMNVNDSLWKSSASRNFYYEPQILTKEIVADGKNWVKFFDMTNHPMRYTNTLGYETVTYYRRIIPSMLGITNVPDKDQVQVWKFIEVNGILIFAQRRTNAHEYLPMGFMQPTEDSLKYQSKGLGETLLNFQNLSGTLFRARIASLARSISDRALYDPQRIEKKDINGRNPSSKIAVRPSAYGKTIADAYHQIPFDDRAAQTLYQDIGQVGQWASDAAHINRSQRGQFTRGNRTLQEYMDVMENADSTQQATAILIEDQYFVPMKHQIKINTLQYQNAGTLADPNTQQPVEVNPAELRQATLEFKLADGLLSKDKIMGVQPTLEALQILAQFGQQDMAGNQYDLIAMAAEALNARGARLDYHKHRIQQPAQPPVEEGAQQQPVV